MLKVASISQLTVSRLSRQCGIANISRIEEDLLKFVVLVIPKHFVVQLDACSVCHQPLKLPQSRLTDAMLCERLINCGMGYLLLHVDIIVKSCALYAVRILKHATFWFGP
jgi:hypothetical protein